MSKPQPPVVVILKARRRHTCDVCERTILPGRSYVREVRWHPAGPVTINHCRECLGGRS